MINQYLAVVQAWGAVMRREAPWCLRGSHRNYLTTQRWCQSPVPKRLVLCPEYSWLSGHIGLVML
jgi:hypothetical protein